MESPTQQNLAEFSLAVRESSLMMRKQYDAVIMQLFESGKISITRFIIVELQQCICGFSKRSTEHRSEQCSRGF